MNSRHDRWVVIRRTLAVAVVALAGGEAAVRLTRPDVLIYQDSENSALRFELIPGAHGQKSGAPVEINAQGMIDEVVAMPTPSDERRVLVVGGHETFGLGVPVQENFVHLLGNELRASGLEHARTVNLSMHSYTLAQKVELACQRVNALQPELVVLQLSEGENSNKQPPSLLPFPRLKNAVRENSALARLLMERNQTRRKKHSTSSQSGSKSENMSDATETARQLDRFDDCVRAAHAKAAVLLIPRIDEDSKTPSALRNELESEARTLKIPFFDAAPALDRMKPEEKELRPNEPFLSPAAHKVLADEVERWLKPLIKPRPSPARRPSV